MNRLYCIYCRVIEKSFSGEKSIFLRKKHYSFTVAINFLANKKTIIFFKGGVVYGLWLWLFFFKFSLTFFSSYPIVYYFKSIL